jgi:CheY-like chemotaxis protein
MVAEGLFYPYGMRLDLCRGGEEANRMAQNRDYDIVFMDHMMPGMDGVEATREIRAISSKHRKLPIVAMTANAVAGTREMFLSLGLDDFLVKPIETNALNAILLRWIPLDKQEKAKSPDDKKAFLSHGAQALPNLEGLDATLGLSRANGQREAYLTTLEYFRKDALIALANLNASLENKEYREFAVHIHALKSAAGVTGAAELAARAAALEAASIAGAEGFIAGNIASFRQDLLRLIDGLAKYFEELQKEKDSAPALADEEVKGRLKELRDNYSTLAGDEIEATLKEQLAKNLSEGLKKGLAEVVRVYQEAGPEALPKLLDGFLSPETVH